MRAVRSVLWVLLAILPAACSVLPPAPPNPAHYDFGPLPSPPKPMTMLLSLQASSAPWLDTPAMVYRLEYRDAAQIASYRDSRWVAPPAALFAERLRQRTVPAASAMAPTRLRIDIEEFCQTFQSPERSIAVVRLRATRLDSETGRVLEVRKIVAESDAETADAAGGARALARAADLAIDQLAAWLPPR